MHKFTFVLVGLILLMGIVGFSTIPKDTLVIGANTGIFITLDPAVCYEVLPSVVVMNTYSGLFKLESSNGVIKTVPEIAKSYEISKDGKAWTFHIRHGLTFFDGDPLTADAVIYSYRRVLKLNKSPVWLYESIGLTADNMNKTIKKIDDYTVQIITNKPYAQNVVMSILAESWGGIVDPKITEAHSVNGDMGSRWLTDHSASSGPYILKTWKRNSMIVLEANDRYWRGAPKIKRIIIRDAPESTNQLLSLKRGDIDVAWNLTPDQINSLKGSNNVKIVTTPGQSDEYVGMNAGWGPFKNAKVRLAVKYAIDYQSIIKDVVGGYAINNQGFIPYGYFGYVSQTPFHMDIAKAKELLKEGGYPNGFEVELVTNTTERRRNEAISVQSALAKIGIKARITIMQASQMYSKFRQQGLQMIVAGWGVDFPDADALAKPFADYRVKQLAWRLMWYDDYAANLAEKAGFEKNPAKREQMYEDLTDYWFLNGPFAMLYQPLQYWGVRSEVKGFDKAVQGYALVCDLTEIYK